MWLTFANPVAENATAVAFSSPLHDEGMRNTYRPVLIRASVRHDSADEYIETVVDRFIFTRVLKTLYHFVRLASNSPRTTDECDVSINILRCPPLSFCIPSFSLYLRGSEFLFDKGTTEFEASFEWRPERSLLENGVLFVEQGTKGVKARKNKKI